MAAAIEPQLVFRPMSEMDIDNIIEIENQSYPFPWTAGIFKDCVRVGYCGQVLEIDGEFSAYGIMSTAAEESHILNVTVAPCLCGQGYGRMMVQRFLELAEQQGSQWVLLEVRPSNTIATNLYFSMDFQEIGVRENYYPAKKGREDALILAHIFSRKEQS